MKTAIKKILIVAIWTGLLVFLYTKGFITTDADKIKAMLENHPAKMAELFILLSVGRVLLFIPGVVFMVLGGFFFGPVNGFILSMLSMAISETIVFAIGRYFTAESLNRHLNNNLRDLVKLVGIYGYEFLALGILCPIAPSDLVCLVSSMLNSNYKRYMLTVILANTPLILIYSYMGYNRLECTGENSILMVVIGIFLVYTVSIWLKLKSKSKVADI